MPEPGLLVVISGPSGVGKSTVIERLTEEHEFVFSVSATTRSPRSGERDGVAYHFVDQDRFDAMVEGHELLEWTTYGLHSYGTPAGPIREAIAAGSDILLDIENDGAMQVKAALPEAVTVFVLPPSSKSLRERLAGRGDTTGADFEVRLASAEEQIAHARQHYDWLVVNDDLEQAVAEILRILTVSRRMQQ
jgi:guanylate kinase